MAMTCNAKAVWRQFPFRQIYEMLNNPNVTTKYADLFKIIRVYLVFIIQWKSNQSAICTTKIHFLYGNTAVFSSFSVVSNTRVCSTTVTYVCYDLMPSKFQHSFVTDRQTYISESCVCPQGRNLRSWLR